MSSKPFCRSLLVPALLATALPVAAELVTTISDFKDYHQIGPKVLSFQGGTFGLNVRDGNIILNCASEGIAFVARGDYDGDGVLDIGETIGPGFCPLGIPGVEAVINALFVAPFEEDRIYIYSAPPSRLPRPLQGFVDRSVQVWWDYSQPAALDDYVITFVDLQRGFLPGAVELERQLGEIVPGTYTFMFPRVQDPLYSLSLSYTLYPIPEGYPGRNPRAPSGLRISKVISGAETVAHDPKWVKVGGVSMIELDPRVFNELQWEGINSGNSFPVDRLYFGLIEADDVTGMPTDDTGAAPAADGSNGQPNFSIIFPPPPAPPAFPAPFNISRTDGKYRLPPVYYLPNLGIGTTVAGWLNYQRSLSEASYKTDTSSTYLTFPIRFVDTWNGFVLAGSYTVGGVTRSAWTTGPGAVVPVDKRTKKGDLDGDGYDNFTEWAAGTRINDATSKPGPVILPAPVVAGTPRSGKAALDKTLTAGIQVKFPRTPGISSEVAVEIQWSTDAQTWQTIPTYDTPEWSVREEAEAYVVSTKVERPACFFRMKITEL